ncbi:MAG: transporter [Phycisphaerales bacterium]|nr:transporter [Phycisphaerales bacterium]
MTQLNYAAAEDSRTADRFLRVVPLAFITYGLAYLDRVNYSSAESRLRGALSLSTNLSSLIAALFFLGYFLFQIPGAAYAVKRNVKWLIFWALILWGILSTLTGLLNNVTLLVIDRLLLGAVEGVVLPAMLIYLTRWFTKPERSRANALLILANPVTMATAATLCAFLIAYFDRHPFMGLQGWRMMFVVEGLPSIIWAVAWMFMADERPAAASWLTAPQAAAVQGRLDAEQQGIRHVTDYWAAFGDVRVMLLCGMYACFSAAGYGLMMWLPQIVEEGSKRGVAAAGLLTATPYVLAIPSIMIVSYLADRTMNRKLFVVGSMFTGGAAFCLAYLAGREFPMVAFAGLIVVGSCIYTPCGPLWAWMADLLPRNVVGESMALVNSFGALGAFAGTWIVGWLKGLSHSTGPSFLFQAGCFATAGFLALMVRSKPLAVGGFPILPPHAQPMKAETAS